ncbi:MAG: amidohydrolase family protein [Euzebya sp.]
MIVDAHTHLLPYGLAVAVRRFFGSDITDRLVYSIDHRPTLDALHADGITAVWNLPYARRPGAAADLNQSFLQISDDLADHPVTVIPGCTVHPGDDNPAQDLRQAVEQGARVCKLHCSVGEYQADDPRLAPVYDMAAELGVPVTIHAGHSVTGHTEAADLHAVDVVARRHPATTVVLAHLGHRAHEQAIGLMDANTNLWADLTPVLFDLVPLTAATAIRLSDRLLFGSDAPNCGHTAGTIVQSLRQLGLPSAVMISITGGNARRLVPVRHHA